MWLCKVAVNRSSVCAWHWLLCTGSSADLAIREEGEQGICQVVLLQHGLMLAVFNSTSVAGSLPSIHRHAPHVHTLSSCPHCPGTELLQRLKARWQAQSLDSRAQHTSSGSSAAAAAAAPAADAKHAAAGEQPHAAAEEGHGEHALGPLPMFTSCCPAWINLVEKVGGLHRNTPLRI